MVTRVNSSAIAAKNGLDNRYLRLFNVATSADPDCLDLRAIYGLNCYGASLISTWLDLGAKVVNGAVGVNWFPEPSLSIFLRNWLRGRSYSTAVVRSNTMASRWWQRLLSPRGAKAVHPWVLSSRQIVAGRADVTIDS